MWDLRLANPFGSLSIRKFLVFVAAVAVTVFTYALTAAPTTYAADASWQGGTIKYDGKTYSPLPDAKEGDGLGLDEKSKVYASIDDVNTSPRKAYVIYFDPGVDPAKAETAGFATYDFTDPNKFSGKAGATTISLEPQGEGGATESTTSCVYEGIGWIVCPVTNFIANAVDKLYSVVADFLAVRPLQVTEDNSLYRSWAVMRGFANVAFVIGFMIIIYSQLTNVGLSNYNVKRMLPRLIIAAILVNVSYWVCAAAIDASNILGYSVQNIFMALRNQVANVDHNSWDAVNFSSITTLVLSGGTLGVAAWLSVAAAGGVLGALYFLGPVLLGVLIAALVAVVIMAVRQAIITILVILAPLAFVAYLLPNTEKYFDKWKDLFVTMLVMFPIFSVIFGGSQFAGTAIIQNSSSIIMIILGMAVQVAPLVLLPFLIKFSGGMLGRIGGIVNNKSKGLIDKSKELAQQKSDLRKSQVLARSNLRRRNLMGRTIQGLENGRLNREDEIKANRTEAEVNRLGSAKYQQLHAAQERADLRKHIAEGRLERHSEAEKLVSGEMRDLEIQARATKLDVDLAKAKVEANWEGMRTGEYNPYSGMDASQQTTTTRSAIMALNRSQDATRDIALASMRQEAAKRVQKQQLSDALLKQEARVDGEAILDYAGGVAGQAGADSAIATAIALERKEFNDQVQNKVQLMRHFNLSSEQRQELALGQTVEGSKDGYVYHFKHDDDSAREAAIEEQLKTGSFKQIRDIIAESGTRQMPDGTVEVGKTHKYASTISQAIPANGIANKAVFFGTKTIDDVAQGKFLGQESIDAAIVYNLTAGKVKDQVLAGMDADAIKRMFEVGNNPAFANSISDPDDRQKFLDSSRALKQSARTILDTELLRQSASRSAIKVFEDFADPPTPPPPPTGS